MVLPLRVTTYQRRLCSKTGAADRSSAPSISGAFQLIRRPELSYSVELPYRTKMRIRFREFREL